jgi:hypothetical protein
MAWRRSGQHDGQVDRAEPFRVAVAAAQEVGVLPGVTLVDVSMIGVAGRIYLSGPASAVTVARDAITDVLDRVEGREQP